MKRMSILALAMTATLCFAGTITQTMTWSPAQLNVGTDNGYATVDYGTAPHIERLGAPALPVVPLQVVIPAGAEVTSLEITDLREEPVPGTYTVRPAQHAAPFTDNAPQFSFVEPDPAYYSKDASFPGQPAEFVDAGSKSGYRLASFLVYPVRYNPARRSLSLVTKLTIKVNYADHKVSVPHYTDMQIAMAGSQVSRLVLNPGDVSRFAPPRRTRSFASALLPAGDYEHVIITTGTYVDSLIPLRDWRTRQGWRSTIMTVEQIAASYPGVDTAERMRNFIKDADTTWGTMFVFIARNDAPARQYRNAYGYVDGYPVDYFPSDWYFGCLDGSWNADGDGYWGEPNDSVDCWTDVNVGMITLDGFTELSKYLSKVFRYEFTPDTGWFNKILLGDDVTFSMEYADSIANASATPPWFDLKMYATGGSVTPTTQRYTDSLNHGYPITSVIAHGAVDVYGMGGDITSPMMNALTNTNRLSMFTGVCCHTGAWDEAGSTNGDCIAENMAFHAPNGFIGVMMNSRYGWIDCAEYFNYSICYGLLGHQVPRRITQGEALSYGKDYWHALVAQTADTGMFRWEAYERTLFGEPAVPIWTGAAFNVAVTKPSAINVGGSIPVNITVNTATDAPVDSAMVCLIKGTETFARGFTDASGQVTLSVSPLTPGFLQLTVTGGNNIPYLDSIAVISTGLFVSFLRNTVNDTTGGNGDGIINPGESFSLPTWVKNYGSLAANSVTARLRTHTAGATVTDSTATFGTVGAGDSAFDHTAFGMSVDNGLANGYPVACSLICRDALDSTWVSFMTLHVGAPVLGYVEKSVRDSLGSQPNGKLDPGETADLTVTLSNSGLANAYNVHAALRSGDARLVVLDSLADYGTISHGANGTNDADHFQLAASGAIPMETSVPCTLDVVADAGYAASYAFTIVVGEIRAIDPIPDGPRTPTLYYAYDDLDAGYDEAPTFGWVEINGVGTSLVLDDDQTQTVSLPGAFGRFRFYGSYYTQMSICSNGFVAPGSSTVSTYTNTALPSTSMPPMLAAMWDDMDPSSGGTMWYYHDAANHRFIIEWDSVPHWNTSTCEKFEVVLYDSTLAAEDGNSEFTYQYAIMNQATSMTVGEQDPTMTIAIQALFDGTYHRGSSPVVAGRAIKFTTDGPQTGVAEPDYGSSRVGLTRLSVTPNPFRGAAVINWQVQLAGQVELAVYDASGRVVRTLASGAMPAGGYTAQWDGTDNAGRSLGHGIYFVRLVTPDRTLTVKAVLSR
jgi:hypothetical protein